MRHETTDNLLAIKDVVRVTRAKSNGSGWTGHCPLRSGHNHGDAHPSLDIKQGDKFPTGFATYICRTVNDHTFKKLKIGEHTSELQSLAYLVCRLLLEKKKHLETRTITNTYRT